MNQKQACPNCPDTPVRTVFPIGAGNSVVECTRCKLQFAEEYPDYDLADSEIYTYKYFDQSPEGNEVRRRIFGELLAELETIAEHKGRLLDIGAGDGTLLQAARKRGWRVEGIELSSAMVRHMRDEHDLTAHHGAVEETPLPSGSYDAIILNHVLEHVKNPRATMERVAELLSPDGVVRIEVPNLGSLSSRLKNAQNHLGLRKNRWRHYSTGHHFWFFKPATLRKTLETAGLLILRLNAPASQWGEKHAIRHLTNTIYKKTLFGGHLVAYARRRIQR